MRVACVQMCSGADVAENLRVVSELLETAAAGGVKLVLLPENFALMGAETVLKKQVAREVTATLILPALADLAGRLGLYVVAGSVLIPGSGGRLRNACFVYGPDGASMGRYDKIHLFDVELPGETYRESDLVEPGAGPCMVELNGWRLGLSICYDLRFPELYRLYADKGAEVLTVPAAFTLPTGRAHWEVLLRARAIENQAWVLAAAQVGTHPGGRKTWGRSLIIDPWGEIVAQGADFDQSDAPALVIAEMDRLRVEQARARIPALSHRRPVGFGSAG